MQGLIVCISSKLKITDVRPRSTDENVPKRTRKLTLNLFGGNSTEFQSFWVNFKEAVHENDLLGNIVKFNYLRNHLHGSTLSAIAKNYDEAVKIIKYRFGYKQLLISSNMDKLLSTAAVSSTQNVESLRELYNKIETYARNLKWLNVDRNQYVPVLIHSNVKITTRDEVNNFAFDADER